MRFGIMTMQKNRLLPSALPTGGIAEYLATFDQAALVGSLAGLGFDPIELSGDLALFFPPAFDPGVIERLAALRAERGLSYTVHLPLWSVDLSTPLQPVRQASLQAVIAVLRATEPLEPEVYVLHPTGPLAAEFMAMGLPAAARALLMRLFQAQAARSIQELLAATGVDSRRIAIETIEFPLELTLELAEQLDLSLCLDTGHVLSGFCGPTDMAAVLEACLPRLAEVHLHDSPVCPAESERLYGQDHRALGTGDLELAGLLEGLEAAGFAGPVILEVTVEEALASLEAIRALRPGMVTG